MRSIPTPPLTQNQQKPYLNPDSNTTRQIELTSRQRRSGNSFDLPQILLLPWISERGNVSQVAFYLQQHTCKTNLCSMAPAQAFLGLDHGIKPEIISSEALPMISNVNRNVFSAIKDTEGSKYEDIYLEENGISVETLLDQCSRIEEESDSAVDVLGLDDDGGERFSARTTGGDTTEGSSSFGYSLSGSDDGFNLYTGDIEVESQFHGENGASIGFHGSDRAFGASKKKLTADWKKYISSVRWRCHWLELKIKEVLSQASKYDNYISECTQRKQLKYGPVALEGSAARSLALSCNSLTVQAKKRRRRKKIEDTIDVQSYMSSHNLFSYYEKKRSEIDAVTIDNNCSGLQGELEINSGNEFGGDNDWASLKFRDGDSSSEQLFQSIEGLQSHVLKLKAQLNKLISRNAEKFSSMETFGQCLTTDPAASSAQSPSFSMANFEENPLGSLFTSCQNFTEFENGENFTEFENGDLVLPESVVPSYGDPALPDLIDLPHIRDSQQAIIGDVLLQKQVSEEDLQNHEMVGEPVEKPCEEKMEEEEERETDVPAVSAPDPSILRFCLLSDFHIPRNKRTQIGQRARSDGWNVDDLCNRRFSDKQDNQ